jgi:2,4'-dihydroxyacetophenone dioxygenase
MAVTQLSNETSALSVSAHRKPGFIDPDTLEWAPWVMQGTWFKLMAVDQKSGGFTMFLRVDPGVEAPVHGHIGLVEGMVTKGEFGYGDDRGAAGSYIRELGGILHQPDTPGGTEMFAIAHGPIVGYNPDGSIAAVVDAKLMLQMARAAGMADHIEAEYLD